MASNLGLPSGACSGMLARDSRGLGRAPAHPMASMSAPTGNKEIQMNVKMRFIEAAKDRLCTQELDEGSSSSGWMGFSSPRAHKGSGREVLRLGDCSAAPGFIGAQAYSKLPHRLNKRRNKDSGHGCPTSRKASCQTRIESPCRSHPGQSPSAPAR